MGWVFFIGCAIVCGVIWKMLGKQHRNQQNRIVNNSRFKRRFDK